MFKLVLLDNFRMLSKVIHNVLIIFVIIVIKIVVNVQILLLIVLVVMDNYIYKAINVSVNVTQDNFNSQLVIMDNVEIFVKVVILHVVHVAEEVTLNA